METLVGGYGFLLQAGLLDNKSLMGDGGGEFGPHALCLLEF